MPTTLLTYSHSPPWLGGERRSPPDPQPESEYISYPRLLSINNDLEELLDHPKFVAEALALVDVRFRAISSCKG